jgi:hypothetical protein
VTSAQHKRWLTRAAWIGFVLMIGIAAYLALAACALGIRPLFGLSYCRAEASISGLAAEQQRERDLLDRLHQAQLDVARLPVCLPDPPPQPERHADNVVPPTPPPAPPPPAAPPSPPEERLTVPHNLSELKGCWQSVDGDLQMTSDDAEQRPIGTVRICYCIGDNGRGSARYIYNDGDKCSGALRAQISGGRLIMKHPRLNCTGDKNYVTGEDIVCSTREGQDSASCDKHVYGVRPETITDEKYHRVTPEHCQ